MSCDLEVDTTHEELMEEYYAGEYGGMPAWGARKGSLQCLSWSFLKHLAQKNGVFLQSDMQLDLARKLGKLGYYFADEKLYRFDEDTNDVEVVRFVGGG